MDFATATLTALSGSPLADARVRATVLSAATALAERTGVKIVRLEATDRSIEATLEAEEVVAVVFAAELRRMTNDWWRARHPDETLWGESNDWESP